MHACVAASTRLCLYLRHSSFPISEAHLGVVNAVVILVDVQEQSVSDLMPVLQQGHAPARIFVTPAVQYKELTWGWSTP